MSREELEKYINEKYNIIGENPWVSHPSFEVFRHKSNKKWFAVIMEIPRFKIGLSGDGRINVVNLKCDPLIIGSLLSEGGIYRGYHMNKNYWITVCLDSSVEYEKVKCLLDISFVLTESKKKK